MSASEPDVLTKQIRIEARPEIVFSFFTDPEKIIRWKGIKAGLEPRPGGIYRVVINERDIARGEYVEVVPHTRVVFTWGWEGAGHPLPPGASTVEVTLTPDGSGTLVQLRHYNLTAAVRDVHAAGWDHYLQRLAAAVEGRDPGPDPNADPSVHPE